MQGNAVISFQAPGKNTEDISEPFSLGGNIKIVFQGLYHRHLGSIRTNFQLKPI